jgi:hypothetical protein
MKPDQTNKPKPSLFDIRENVRPQGERVAGSCLSKSRPNRDAKAEPLVSPVIRWQSE